MTWQGLEPWSTRQEMIYRSFSQPQRVMLPLHHQIIKSIFSCFVIYSLRKNNGPRENIYLCCSQTKLFELPFQGQLKKVQLLVLYSLCSESVRYTIIPRLLEARTTREFCWRRFINTNKFNSYRCRYWCGVVILFHHEFTNSIAVSL